MLLIYKCPACGGGMKMNAKTNELSCEYCENRISIFDYASCEIELQEEACQKEAWHTDTRAFHCPVCGAKMAAVKEAITCICSFCGTDMLLEEQLEGELAPDKIIPFSLTREEAVQAIESYISAQIGAVYEIKEDCLQGIYVPFWLYDFGGQASIKGTGRLDRTTYRILREGRIMLEKVPLDASINMNNALMDAILPYQYSSLYDFQKGALAGFMAERYDYRYDDMQERLRKKIEEFTATTLKDEMCRVMKDPHGMNAQKYHRYTFPMDYEEVKVEEYNSRTYLEGIHYALLPVWYYTFTYEGKKYQAAVNGQTGKAVGTLSAPPTKKAASFGRRWLAASAGMLGTVGLVVIEIFGAEMEKWQEVIPLSGVLALTAGAVAVAGFIAAVWQFRAERKQEKKEAEFVQTGQYLAWDGFELTQAKDLPCKN